MRKKDNKKQTYLSSLDWVDSHCKQYKNLTLEGCSIRAFKSSFIDVFGVAIIKWEYKYAFKIQSLKGFIGFGVSDIVNVGKYQMNGRFIYLDNTGNLYANDQRISQQRQYEQFIRGDTVSVFINPRKHFIQFEINGIPVCRFQNKSITNRQARFVPFIRLFQGCQITLIQSTKQAILYPTHLALGIYQWDQDLLCQMHNKIDFDYTQVKEDQIKQNQEEQLQQKKEIGKKHPNQQDGDQDELDQQDPQDQQDQLDEQDENNE